MEESKGFYDFCVPYNNDKRKIIEILKELHEMRYTTIAIEQIYDHTKKNSNKISDVFPEPINLDFLIQFRSKLKILHRLTIIYSDPAISHLMTNSFNIKKYNLIAGLPKTEASFNHCCSAFNGDIIAFDPDCKLTIQRKMYHVAVKRGICFEIKYSPIIINSNIRKDVIKVAHNYHAKGKSNNIIFTSGAINAFEIRGPYDVANLALLFGLTEEQGRSSISNACHLLALKAESRRIGKTIMLVKQNGPMVFSSEDDTDNENDEELEINVLKEVDDKFVEQPHKKKKLS